MVPTGKLVPGSCEYVTMALQLSVAVAMNDTIAAQSPGSLFTIISPGHVIIGASVSLIVTSKLQVAVFPAPSVTTNVFVVVPTGKVLPLGRPAVCVTTGFCV